MTDNDDKVKVSEPAAVHLDNSLKTKMVKTLTTDGSDDTLCGAVLPRRSEAGRTIPNAHRPDPSLEDGAELHIIVSDQIPRR